MIIGLFHHGHARKAGFGGVHGCGFYMAIASHCQQGFQNRVKFIGLFGVKRGCHL